MLRDATGWMQDTQHRAQEIAQRTERRLETEIASLIALGVSKEHALREVALAAYRWGARVRDEVVGRAVKTP